MMIGLLDIYILSITLGLLLYWWTRRTYTFWEKKGVAFIPPVPFFGNMLSQILGKKSSAEHHLEMYSKLKMYPYAGIYMFTTPIFYAHKPELVEAILIKDFSYFYNRGTNADPELDPFTSHLVNLEDEVWKNLRTKLTPVFSSGKLRIMEEKLMDCATELVEYIQNRTGEPQDVRETMARFTTDVIGAIAFGIQMNSIRNPDSEFRKFGKNFFNASLLNRIRSIIRTSFPKVLKLLRWRALSNASQNFFVSVIKETIKQREMSETEGKDFLQLLINLRKQDKSSASSLVETENRIDNHNETDIKDSEIFLNDQLLISNAFIFFSAGFETTSSTLSYCLFELSCNEDIQERLYQELREVLEKNDNCPTYDTFKQIPYVEQVILETLRKWPPVPNLPRICTKDYQIPGTNIIIKRGERVNVPIFPIHRDPQYWPNPEKFDPDRFSPENKKNIIKGSFIPFGEGPRICIGMRFALYEMKVALAKMLMAFKVTLNQKTKVSFSFKKTAFFLVPDTQLLVDFYKRN